MHLDIHRSSASRLVGTLAQRGFLERVPQTERFRLGPAVARLGLLVVGGRGLISESSEAMELLAEQTGEATVMSVVGCALWPNAISLRVYGLLRHQDGS